MAVTRPREAKDRGEGRRSHAERRQEAETRILQAALHIIAERGLDELTLAEAGEMAGYSRALPAHYFGAREQMLAAVAEHVVLTYRARLHQAGEATPDRAYDLKTLLGAIGFYFEVNRHNPKPLRAFYEIVDAAPRWPAMLPVVTRLNRESFDMFARHIRNAQAGGHIRADIDPDAEAVVIMGALKGVMGQWLLDPERVDLDKAKAALLASLRRSWAPEKG